MTAPTKRTRAAAKAAAPVKAATAAPAPVKRARPAKRVAPVTVVEEAPAAEAELEPGTIRFKGRKMRVVTLSPDQWAMWVLTAEQMQDSFDALTAKDKGKLVKLLRRAYQLILLVLEEDDKDWLQGEVLQGRVEIEEAAGVLALALTAYEAASAKAGKAPAPTTGPRPKARRGR